MCFLYMVQPAGWLAGRRLAAWLQGIGIIACVRNLTHDVIQYNIIQYITTQYSTVDYAVLYHIILYYDVLWVYNII